MKGMEAGGFRRQENVENKHFNDGEDTAMYQRMDKINEDYAKKKLFEMESTGIGQKFTRELLDDSLVKNKLEEWKLCEALKNIQNNDNEIDVPGLGMLDAAVVGKMIMLKSEELERTN